MTDFWASVTGFGDALDSLKAAGAGAGWAINESGGQALISAAQDLYDDLSEILMNAKDLGQELPLGTTPAAQVYKPFVATVATDPQQGMIAVLTTLRNETLEFKTEVEKAMNAYEAVDEGSKQGISKAGGPTS